jgi:hypothetical protein
MVQNPISAVGARLDTLLQAQDARLKASQSAKSQASSVPFILPDGTQQFGYAPSYGAPSAQASDTNAQDISAADLTAGPSSDLGVGATIRRSGVPLDVPMRVTRVGDGVVFANMSDHAGTREMAFPSNHVEVVTKASRAEAFPAVSSYQNAIALMSSATLAETPVATNSVGLAPAITAPVINSAVITPPFITAPVTATPVATTPSMAAPVTSVSVAESNVAARSTTRTVTSSAPAAAPTPPPTAATTPVIPNASDAPYVMLPDGTKQFGYAPTGGLPGAVRSVMPAVPSQYGVGATIRRQGVTSDTPMTITRTGDGIVFANMTDWEGTREMAFLWNHVDLVTPAPG